MTRKQGPDITQERLRELVSYDPITGHFFRLKRVSNIAAGSVLGSVNAEGYLCAQLDGRCYRLHRLAWLYMHGHFPRLDIDHVNGNRRDNRLANLREADDIRNQWNRKTGKNNKSGVKGVHWRNDQRVWIASVRIGGRRKIIGRFHSLEAASEAIAAFRIAHHGEFARI